MRATVSQVRGWQPEAAAAASDALAAANLQFSEAMRFIGRRVDAVVEGWRGAAATAGALRAYESQLAANHLGAAVLGIADALAEAGTLAGVRESVLDIEAEAEDHGCVVGEDGSVAAPHADTGNAALDLALQVCFDARAQVLQARLISLLETAGEVDAKVGARLTAAVETLVALRHAPQGAGMSRAVADLIDGRAALPEDPKALCALWDSLSPADRDTLVAYDPALGGRDGIPVLDRDFYNRQELERLRTTTASRLAILDGQHPGWARRDELPTTSREWIRLRPWESERAELSTHLAEYEIVARDLEPGRYLLGVDDHSHGVIALGNPDAARNIATFVPGTGATLSDIGEGIARATTLRTAAEAADHRARTAVIAWYGYDAPPDLLAAASDHAADAGAPLLDRFEQGLRVTHREAPAHTVVVGHSYGTTLIGAAAAHGNSLAADELILAGSPGLDVDRVSELRLDGISPDRNGSHVFATAAPGDPVPAFGRFVHGPEPTDPGFGATVFESAGPGSNFPLMPDIPVFPWAHGNYWDSGNPGLASQGEIIAGTYYRR